MVESKEQWFPCYTNKKTGQISEKEPPNEVLPDGWTHVYYRDYDKFAYMELETNKVVATIEEIPGYVPPQEPQEKQEDDDSQENDDNQDMQEKQQEPVDNLQVTPSGGDDGDDNDDDAAKQDESQQSDATEGKKDEPADQDGQQEQSNPQPQQEPPQPQQTKPSDEPSEDNNNDGDNVPESDKLPESQQQQQQELQSNDVPEDDNNDDKNDTENDKLLDAQKQVEPSDDVPENNKDGDNDTDKNAPESDKLPDAQGQSQPQVEPHDDVQEVKSDGDNAPGNDELSGSQQQQQQQQPEQSDDTPEDDNSDDKNDTESDKLSDAQKQQQPEQSDGAPEVKSDGDNALESDKLSDTQEQQKQQVEPSSDAQKNKSDGGNLPESDKLSGAQQQVEQSDGPPEDNNNNDKNVTENDKLSGTQEQQQQQLQVELSNDAQKDGNNDDKNDPGSGKLLNAKQQQQSQPPQSSPQSDLPKGWVEEDRIGIHWYGCEPTGQLIKVKPPNEVLPDGWFHYYVERHERFGYVNPSDDSAVWNISDIPGYVPPPEPQQQQQQSQSIPSQPPQQTESSDSEQKNANDNNAPDTQEQNQDQPSPQSDLPKGWIEEEKDGVNWYGCEPTGQWIQAKPPNEVLPDGWFHYYVEQYKRFGYVNPSAKTTVWNITDIPGYVPLQEPQPQQQGDDGQDDDDNQDTQEKQQEPADNLQVTPSGGDDGDDNDDDAAKQDESQQSDATEGKKDEPADQDGQQKQSNPQPQQEPPQQPQPPQPLPQNDLPKGWIEKDQDGVHWYGCESTGQWTQVKPPNEALPDGWFHVYYDEYQKFAYMELDTNKVVASINDIPGYVPPQTSQVPQQQPPQSPQPSPQSDLPKGWVEKDQDGVHLYGCELTGQWTQVKPPNEVLPDGWTHVYYEQYQKFAYMELGTNRVVATINDVPRYVPLQTPQEQQPQSPQTSQPPQQAESSDSEQKNTNDIKLPDTQQPQQQQPPQPLPQNDLPKGWIEKEQDGVRWYGCELTGQWTQVKPPNEVLPDGWTHVYYEQYQKFAYMELETNRVVATIDEIPGYVPPSQTPQEQQPPRLPQQAEPSGNEQKNMSDTNAPERDKSPEPQQPPQPSPQGDLPKGWVEKEQDGVHWYGCGPTNQWTQAKPPNEVLPDGWFHYYVKEYQRFGYFNPSTNQNKWNITDIPGYIPPQEPQEPQQQPLQPSQLSQQSDLPKGWIEKEQNGIHWYGCESTRQWTQAKPPNEVLPDGWFHYYVNNYQRFGYINPSTNQNKWNITDIPGYIPPQEPQQQPPQSPQPSPSNDLPKGWSEVVDQATGVHFFVNGATDQQTTVKPPNEVLPDGWTHVYYEQYQKFAYMKIGTDMVVASVSETYKYAHQ